MGSKVHLDGDDADLRIQQVQHVTEGYCVADQSSAPPGNESREE